MVFFQELRVFVAFNFFSATCAFLAFVGNLLYTPKKPRRDHGVAIRLLLFTYLVDFLGSTSLIICEYTGICLFYAIFVGSFIGSGTATNCLGFHLLFVASRMKSYEKTYYVVAIIPPIVFGAISFIIESGITSFGSFCTYRNPITQLICFQIPQIVGTVVNLVQIWILTAKLYKSQKTFRNLAKTLVASERRLYFRMLGYILVLVGVIMTLDPGIVTEVGYDLLALWGGIHAISTNTKQLQKLGHAVTSRTKNLLTIIHKKNSGEDERARKDSSSGMNQATWCPMFPKPKDAMATTEECCEIEASFDGGGGGGAGSTIT